MRNAIFGPGFEKDGLFGAMTSDLSKEAIVSEFDSS